MYLREYFAVGSGIVYRVRQLANSVIVVEESDGDIARDYEPHAASRKSFVGFQRVGVVLLRLVLSVSIDSSGSYKPILQFKRANLAFGENIK